MDSRPGDARELIKGKRITQIDFDFDFKKKETHKTQKSCGFLW
jgi:hypothetical protein